MTYILSYLLRDLCELLILGSTDRFPCIDKPRNARDFGSISSSTSECGEVSKKSLQLSPIVVAPEPSIGADRPVLPSPSVAEELADGVERAFPQLPPVPVATPSLEELEESLDAAPPTQPVAASLEQRIGTLEEQLSQILDQLDKTSEELVRLRELLQSDDDG